MVNGGAQLLNAAIRLPPPREQYSQSLMRGNELAAERHVGRSACYGLIEQRYLALARLNCGVQSAQ